uniref:Uncharacterized protein n=1 Tax=Anguilla anguilla TaxID=7936 RepID=A0A0E9WF06_ANGAN
MWWSCGGLVEFPGRTFEFFLLFFSLLLSLFLWVTAPFFS